MYTVVGYSQFVSKKGQSFINFFVTCKASNVQGVKTDQFVCPAGNVQGDLKVGCQLDVVWSRTGFPTSVTVK